MHEGKRIDKLNEYIDENLVSLKATIDTMPNENKADWENLIICFFS